MRKIFELKERIKKLASEQKELRPQRKSSYEGVRTHRKPHPWEHQWEAARNQMICNSVCLRNMHVAYCLLRGTPIEKIEPKHKDGKQLYDTTEVQSIMKEYADEEAVCARAG